MRASPAAAGLFILALAFGAAAQDAKRGEYLSKAAGCLGCHTEEKKDAAPYAGGRALKTGTPIQRFWRDAHAGRVHAINDPERALSMFGRGEFGLDLPPEAML